MKEEVLYTDKSDYSLIIIMYIIILIIPIYIFCTFPIEIVVDIISLPFSDIRICIIMTPLLFGLIFFMFSCSYYIKYQIKITNIGIYYKNFRINEFIAWEDIQAINIKKFKKSRRPITYHDILIVTKKDNQKTPLIMRGCGIFKQVISNKAINKKHITLTENRKIKTPFSFEWCVVNSYKILMYSLIPILLFFLFALIKTRLL